jgi:hypothetical protein
MLIQIFARISVTLRGIFCCDKIEQTFHHLTPWRRVLLTTWVAQLIKKFSVIYGTRILITAMCTRTHELYMHFGSNLPESHFVCSYT